MIAEFRRLIGPIQRRVALMVGRAVIRLVDDTLKAQVVQIDALAGETLSGVERFQEYGFTSVPQSGAEAVFVCVAGNRSHGIVIAVEDRRYRLKGMVNGEVALYDDLGQVVHLKRSGIDVVTSQKLRLEGDTVEIVAHTTLRHDIGGHADELTYQGGTDWAQTTWQTGANVTKTANAIDPPEHFSGS